MTTTKTTKTRATRNEKPATPPDASTLPEVEGALLDDVAISLLRPRMETVGKHAGTLRPTKTFLGKSGLYVLTTKTGKHSFRFGYTDADGKPQTWTLGLHGPQLSRAQAEQRHAELLPELRGVAKSTAIEIRAEVDASEGDGRRFDDEALDWFVAREKSLSPRYAKQVRRSLDKDILPALGRMKLKRIQPPHVLAVCKTVEQRGALDVADDVRRIISMIFKRAKNHGKSGVLVNPAADTHEELTKRKRSHFAAAMPGDLPRLFADIRDFAAAGKIVRRTELGLRLMLHINVRTDTLRHTRREWVNFETREIRYPTETPGLQKHDFGPDGPDYVVPLSEQSVALLREIMRMSAAELLFPHRSEPWRPCSNGTWLVALKRMGWDGELAKSDPNFRPNLTVHGFRSTFRTICAHEWADKRAQEYAVECQMDHIIDDEELEQLQPYLRVGEGHRGAFLQSMEVAEDGKRGPGPRVHLMTWWSDYLDRTERTAPAPVERGKRDAAKGGRAAQAVLADRRKRGGTPTRPQL
jgi:Phage integrase central domain